MLSQWPITSVSPWSSQKRWCESNPLWLFGTTGGKRHLWPEESSYESPHQTICKRAQRRNDSWRNDKSSWVTWRARGWRVAVVEIDTSKDLHEANKIPDISLLYNFKFEDSGTRVWKAYNIGEGKLLKYLNCKSNHKISQASLSSSRLDLARKNVAS